jgi:ubiquinone/menaquinone biosynthesis C-methylase UbiE
MGPLLDKIQFIQESGRPADESFGTPRMTASGAPFIGIDQKAGSMAESVLPIHEDNRFLQAKYNLTAWFYDILDYPWERQYRNWRPILLQDVQGKVLEPGVGTGQNLRYYRSDVNLLGIDISPAMLKKAASRGKAARCNFELRLEDATAMTSIPSNHFDWIVSLYLCCVMPDHLQPLAIKQFERVLKPGGRFRLLDMVYSKDPKLRRRQDFFSRFIERVYGARFDRNTLSYLQNFEKIRITNTYFIKKDVYLVIEGQRAE